MGGSPGATVGGGVTIVSKVSTSALTIWAVVVAGASVLLLVAVDHRKPARRRAVAKRGVPLPWRPPVAQTVEQRPVRRYRRPRWWQRLAALGGAGVLGVVLGAVLAIVVAGVVVGLFLVLDNIVK
jgi:hypothetical protein